MPPAALNVDELPVTLRAVPLSAKMLRLVKLRSPATFVKTMPLVPAPLPAPGVPTLIAPADTVLNGAPDTVSKVAPVTAMPVAAATETARLRRNCHRLVWLNPLAADPRYEPLTRGMQAAMPHLDRLLGRLPDVAFYGGM